MGWKIRFPLFWGLVLFALFSASGKIIPGPRISVIGDVVPALLSPGVWHSSDSPVQPHVFGCSGVCSHPFRTGLRSCLANDVRDRS